MSQKCYSTAFKRRADNWRSLTRLFFMSEIRPVPNLKPITYSELPFGICFKHGSSISCETLLLNIHTCDYCKPSLRALKVTKQTNKKLTS